MYWQFFVSIVDTQSDFHNPLKQYWRHDVTCLMQATAPVHQGNVCQANLLVAHRTIHGDIMGHPGDLQVEFGRPYLCSTVCRLYPIVLIFRQN